MSISASCAKPLVMVSVSVIGLSSEFMHCQTILLMLVFLVKKIFIDFSHNACQLHSGNINE